MTTRRHDTLSKLIGLPTAHIDTPALVVDLDAMGRNLKRMAEFAAHHAIKLRPHAKMHKSAALARLQMQAGAVGVCVQKTSEAEIMAEGGILDIFISNQVIAPAKLARVAALAHSLHTKGGRLALAVDSALGVQRLASALAEAGQGASVDVFIELDVGHGRCGIKPGHPAVMLALDIQRQRGLRFAGLHAYHGKAQHLSAAKARRAAISQVVAAVSKTKQLIEATGIRVELVTGAGTGTFSLEAASGVYGELQAGSFMFMDAAYAQNEADPAQPQFEHALFVKSQVISVNPEHAVCDAGHKSHAIDSGLPLVHALTPEQELQYFNGGDEHGILRTAGANETLPELGDTVWLIPGHCDPTVNLHDHLIGVRGGLQGGAVERIIRVDARGAVT